MVCHECDLLVDMPVLELGQKAFCPRCAYLLAANRPNAGNSAFAFAMTALIFLSLANSFPFLGFAAQGQERTVTLIEGLDAMVAGDLPSLAVIVFLSIVLIPAIFLLGVIYVSIALKLGRLLPGTRFVLRWALLLMPWSMAEIFIIGILVSFVKIVSLADVALGLSFWAYATFTLCTIAVVMNLDRRDIWRRVHELSHA